MNFIYELMIIYSFIVCTIYVNKTISAKRKNLQSQESTNDSKK